MYQSRLRDSVRVLISRRNQRKIETENATRKPKGNARVRVAAWPRRGSARTGSALGPADPADNQIPACAIIRF